MGRWDEFIKKVKDAFINKTDDNIGEGIDAYVIAIWTDDFKVLTLADFLEKVSSDDKLLDVRVFNNDIELRIFRDYMNNEFSDIVEISDAVFGEPYEDEQYIDYDAKRSHIGDTGRIKATGGGEYSFPINVTEKTKVIIKNYVDYDDCGQAYIKAWRVAGFKN